MAYKKSEETRKKILEISRTLFAEKGFYGTELKEIAKAAGMAHTGVYYYFKRKEDIASELYTLKTDEILSMVDSFREREGVTPLYLCILHYVLMMEELAFNPVTADCFFDMVNYRTYDRKELARVRESYYVTLEQLFQSCQVQMSENEMNIYILTSDAYAKALLSALKSGVIEYTATEAVDHFFRHLLLPDLGISYDTYQACRKQVLADLVKEGVPLTRFQE